MAETCADFTQGILAHNNVDLLSNGYINAIDTNRRGQQVQMLPSDRISVEFQYSIRSDITGTSLNSISPGGNAGFIAGSLGAGAGFALGSAIGCSLLGDIEPTKSRFVFHVCKSETKRNARVPITQAMLDEAKANKGVATYQFGGEYPIAFLGITLKPIDLSEEEIASIGSTFGNTIGHTITNEGLVQAQFVNYDSSSADNLFIEIVRDPRKFKYRADNNIPGDPSSGANAFLSASGDDLTDRKIRIQLFPSDFDPNSTEGLPKVGDFLFMTYDSATERPIRQAIFVSSTFFVFPAFDVERIGVDQVRAWNFSPYRFKAHKNVDKKATIADILYDEKIAANQSLDASRRNALTRLETIEGQRIVEVINDTKTNRPYISGFYFADTRGILMFDMSNFTSPPELLIEASQIRDQVWWKSFIDSFVDFGPGFNSQGHLDVTSDTAIRFMKGFVFDISDHVNCVCYDNDKFGYQRDFAAALQRVSRFDPAVPTSGVGISNLDLMSLGLPHADKYDLSSAKFDQYIMSSVEGGAYFVRDCNKVFTYDQAFCTYGTLQADMFIRTPFFFDQFPVKSRIYVERFTPQFPLSRSGGIWVLTRPVSGNDISVDHVPFRDESILVFNKGGTLNYHKFSDALLHMQLSFSPENVSSPLRDHTEPPIDTLTEGDVDLVGYDQIYGNQPSYSKGIEVTTETGRIDRGYLEPSIYKKANLVFTQNKTTASATAIGITDKRIKTITLTYTPDSDDFTQKTKRSLAFIFPKNNLVIDNVVLSYTGGDPKAQRTVTFAGGYYTDDSVRIIGDILKYVTINKIEVLYLAEENYQQYTVSSANSSVVVDGKGNIYIFYEDTQSNPSPPPSESGGPGFSTSDHTEISCLVSSDSGSTWFDHKAVVRTIGDETVRSPVAVCDKKNNVIHLMYVHNDCLMHKSISTSLFDNSDAFWWYSRPLSYSVDFPDYYGLSRYSNDGVQLRMAESYVVIGNLSEGSFMDSQLSIDDVRRVSRFPRFSIRGDRKSYEEGFAESSYIVVLDRKTTLKVLYVSKGKIHVRVSDSYGESWMDSTPDGMAFHKNVATLDPQTISSIGYAFDEASNILHLTYIVDGMMFLKSFDITLLEPNSFDIKNIEDPDSNAYAPTFVVGSITDEVSRAVRSKNSNIQYRYPDGSMGVFNQKMSISDVGSRGFVGSRGLARFFYLDGDGDIRAFLLPNTRGVPSLDSKRKAGG